MSDTIGQLESGNSDPIEIERLTCATEDLPDIEWEEINKSNFWNRRELRPNQEGPNFHNLPVLQFGISVDSDLATLSVPTIEYLTQVTEKYNPGGLTFTQGKENGMEKADDLLAMLSAKHFPISKKENDARLSVINDSWMAFLYPEESDFFNTLGKYYSYSVYEHDMIEHIGLIALPEKEADKIAITAKTLLDLPQDIKPDFVGRLDRILDILSRYAIVPTSPNSKTERDYKEWLWTQVMGNAGILYQSVGERVYDEPITHELDQDIKDSLRRKLFALGINLDIDRQSYDQKIGEMQALSI